MDGAREGDLLFEGEPPTVFAGSRLMDRRRSANEARRSLIKSFTMVTDDLLLTGSVASEELDSRRSLDNLLSWMVSLAGIAL